MTPEAYFSKLQICMPNACSMSWVTHGELQPACLNQSRCFPPTSRLTLGLTSGKGCSRQGRNLTTPSHFPLSSNHQVLNPFLLSHYNGPGPDTQGFSLCCCSNLSSCLKPPQIYRPYILSNTRACHSFI